MVLCINNVLEQEIVHLSMAYYVHVLLYNAAKHIFAYELFSFVVIKHIK
jgi:hypothetical protein